MVVAVVVIASGGFARFRIRTNGLLMKTQG